MVRPVGGPPPQPPEFSKVGSGSYDQWVNQLEQAKTMLLSNPPNLQGAKSILGDLLYQLSKMSGNTDPNVTQAAQALQDASSDIDQNLPPLDAVTNINRAIQDLKQ